MVLLLFHRSSVVEQSAVNRSVVGSNPTGGAIGELSEWSKEHDWKSCRLLQRSRGFESLALRHYLTYIGPLVKWLRHRPFTAVTRVRIPYGSPLFLTWFNEIPRRISSAGRAPALQAGGRRFEPVILHHI